MAESTLSLDRTDYLGAIGRWAGKSRNPSEWNDAEFLDDANNVLDTGVRQFVQPPILPGETHAHQWSFMQPLYSATLTAPYSTGTITVVDGVVTLASGTFPSWAASGDMVIEGISYSVNTRDSGTQVTLDDTTLDVAAGTDYVLQQWDYDLPDLFGGFRGPLTYGSTGSAVSGTIVRVEVQDILDARESAMIQVSRPTMYAVQVKDQTGAAGTRMKLMLFPGPDAAYGLSSTYTINPWSLTSALPYAMGGMPHAETLRESILAAAEVEFRGERGIHYGLFMERLRTSVSFDRCQNGPIILGHNGDGHDSSLGWDRRPGGRYACFDPVEIGPTLHS